MSEGNIQNRIHTAAGVGCVTLFGLPFALVGLGMAGFVLWTVGEAVAVRQWEAVPVRIVEAELQTHRGDDGDTYSVKARYTYMVDGHAYTGTRVSLGAGGDNLGSYHQRVHAELDARRRDGKPFTGYYNPSNPEKSILYREPRLVMLAFLLIFAGTFTPLGCGLVAGGIYGGAKLREEQALKLRFPEEPWKWRPDWAEGSIHSDSHSGNRVWIVVTLLWLALTVPLFVFAGEYLLQGRYMDALPAAPYLVVDLLLVYFVVRRLGRARRFGRATLSLDPYPAPTGGTLAGVIHTEGALPFHDDLKLTLRSVRERRVRRGNKTSTSRDELYMTEQTVDAAEIDRRGRGSAVAIAFPLPADVPAATSEDSGNKVEWTLEACCQTRGYDFNAKFVLPVFGAAAAPPATATNAETTVQAEALVLDPKVVEVTETASGGLAFHFPRGRFLSGSILMIVFTLIFGGAAVALFLADDAPNMLRVGFSFTVLIMALITIQMLTGSVRTEVEHGEMRIRRVVLMRVKRHRYQREEIEGIGFKNGMRVNERQFYDIIVDLKSGKQVKAGTSIPGSRQAEQIALLMKEALRH